MLMSRTCSEYVHPLTQVQGQVSDGSLFSLGRGDGFSGGKVRSPWQRFYYPDNFNSFEFSQLWGTAEVGCCVISDPLPVLHPSPQQWFINIIFPQYFKGHFHLPWQKEEYFSGTTDVSNFAPLSFILKIIITPMEMQLWCFPLKLPIHLQSGSCSFVTTWDPKCEYNWRSRGDQSIHFLTLLCEEQRCTKGKQLANILEFKTWQKIMKQLWAALTLIAWVRQCDFGVLLQFS